MDKLSIADLEALRQKATEEWSIWMDLNSEFDDPDKEAKSFEKYWFELKEKVNAELENRIEEMFGMMPNGCKQDEKEKIRYKDTVYITAMLNKAKQKGLVRHVVNSALKEMEERPYLLIGAALEAGIDEWIKL